MRSEVGREKRPQGRGIRFAASCVQAPALGSVSATWAPIKRTAIKAFRLGVRFGSALLANTLKLVYTAQRSSSTGPYSLTCRWTQIE